MAITVTAKPHLFVPGYNDTYFGATSTQTAQPNFQYYLTIAINGGTPKTYALPARPSGDMVWNARSVIEKALAHYYPFGLYGWKTCTNGIVKVTVNIGEKYGTTPVVYSGSNYDFYAWNASLQKEERRLYSVANYTYPAPLNQLPYLNSGDSDRDIVFYWLQQSAGAVADVYVKTYDSSNVLIGEYQIVNPFTSATTANLYVCINAGWNGLSNISSGNVTVISGLFPIITGDVEWYELNFEEGGGAEVFYKITKPSCCATSKTLHYVNRFGAYDYIDFCKNNRRSASINKTFYEGIDDYFEGSYLNAASSVVTPSSPLGINKRVLANSSEGKWDLQTDYISEAQQLMLFDCFGSPNYHFQTGSALYQKIQQEDTQFAFKVKKMDKLIQFALKFTDGFMERRQIDG